MPKRVLCFLVFAAMLVLPAAVFASHWWDGTAVYEKDSMELRIHYHYSEGLTPEGVAVEKFIRFTLQTVDTLPPIGKATITCDGVSHELTPQNTDSLIQVFEELTIIPQQALQPMSVRLEYSLIDGNGWSHFTTRELLLYTEGGLDMWRGDLIVAERTAADIEARTPILYEGELNRSTYYLDFLYTDAPDIPGSVHESGDLLTIRLITDHSRYIGPDSYIEIAGEWHNFVHLLVMYAGMKYDTYSGLIEIPITRNMLDDPMLLYIELVDSDLDIIEVVQFDILLTLQETARFSGTLGIEFK